jgi:hypothetical protein
MIRAGERLENPVTGEVLVFHRTSAETSHDSVLARSLRKRGAHRSLARTT